MTLTAMTAQRSFSSFKTVFHITVVFKTVILKERQKLQQITPLKLELLQGTLFILHSNGYVLLTANVEDVQSIAQQVANSPVMQQLKDVWRRASRTFQKNLNSAKMRADDRAVEPIDERADAADDDRSDDRDDSELRAQRREAVEQLVNLGRNASVYLGSIKKMIEKI